MVVRDDLAIAISAREGATVFAACEQQIRLYPRVTADTRVSAFTRSNSLRSLKFQQNSLLSSWTQDCMNTIDFLR
jgi:hypothetical protein